MSSTPSLTKDELDSLVEFFEILIEIEADLKETPKTDQ